MLLIPFPVLERITSASPANCYGIPRSRRWRPCTATSERALESRKANKNLRKVLSRDALASGLWFRGSRRSKGFEGGIRGGDERHARRCLCELRELREVMKGCDNGLLPATSRTMLRDGLRKRLHQCVNHSDTSVLGDAFAILCRNCCDACAPSIATPHKDTAN